MATVLRGPRAGGETHWHIVALGEQDTQATRSTQDVPFEHGCARAEMPRKGFAEKIGQQRGDDCRVVR